MDSNNWSDFEKYLIGRIDKLEEKVTKLRISASIWGGFMGLVASLVTYLLRTKG